MEALQSKTATSVTPFLLKQNLSPKDIARCDIMKLHCRYATLRIIGLAKAVHGLHLCSLCVMLRLVS